VSIVRWNPKEAEGKALAWRTEIIYETSVLDKKANTSKVQYLYGKATAMVHHLEAVEEGVRESQGADPSRTG
jgi:hypothetical protein